jgi:hypothetical protein
MPFDTALTALGSELTSHRALAEGRRRRSLADRLLRERREAEMSRQVRVKAMVPKVSRPSPKSTKS